jgi:hypothetical protein
MNPENTQSESTPIEKIKSIQEKESIKIRKIVDSHDEELAEEDCE